MVNNVEERTWWYLCCCGTEADVDITVMGVASFQLLGHVT